MRTLVILGVLAVWRLTAVAAQAATPYVPLDHWSTPYVEHLIARGAMVDPSPLGRPFRAGDLVRALRAVDSLQVTAAELGIARRIVAELDRQEQGPFGRIDGHVSLSAANYTLRRPLETRCRPEGAGCLARDTDTRGFVAGGLAAALSFGPLVAVTHPYFDTRLKHDPDYHGKKDRVVAGRNAEAYLDAQWRFAELFFGSLDRNWGPSALEGLLVSPAPYSYDHLSLAVGTTGVRLEAVLTQLDDLPDTAGVANHRYLVAHRVVLRPPGRTTMALWEGSVVAGPQRELEPWYANIVNLGLLASYDQGTGANSVLGLDVDSRIGRTRVFGSLLVDDIQVDRDSASDQEPTAYGLTLGAQGALGRASWTAFYTRVSNLTYRTPNPPETLMRTGVGLGRNFSDYDQLTARGGLLVGPALLVAPELTLVRQGEGDFRRPYPPVAAYDTTPTFLAGTVERTVRVAVLGYWQIGRWQIDGDAGAHFMSNADHLSGANETRFVGRVGVTYRFRKESVLP